MLQSRVIIAGTSIAALLIGIALGSRFGPVATESPPAAPTPDADRIAELTRELDHERGLRGALELELSLLRRELEPGPATPTAAAGTTEGSEAASEKDAPEETPHENSASNEWFDTSRLTDIGMDERRAEWLRERFESLQMDELYLRDEAVRGRWNHQARYAHELRELREATRVELGEEDYDSMLYASGRHNRVLLANVLQDSPAAAAGLQAGDILLRYGDRPIYDIRDLLAETASGELGETAPIDVERDGRRLRLYVERGPLGARIRPLSRAPIAGP